MSPMQSFFPARKARDNVATSEDMKHRKCQTLHMVNCSTDPVCRNQSIVFPCTKSHHNEVNDGVSFTNMYTAKTTTSLSTVRTITCLAASATWSIMRVSASSCEQGQRPPVSLSCRQITSSSRVLIICLSV